ncbi:MAG: hypothetical protein V9F03_14850 [Microthrixaceae bacterium]
MVLPSAAQTERESGVVASKLFDKLDQLDTGEDPVLGLIGPTIEGAPWAFDQTEGRTVDLDREKASTMAHQKTPILVVLTPARVLLEMNPSISESDVYAFYGGLALAPASELAEQASD